jgi:hypothetical protein
VYALAASGTTLYVGGGFSQAGAVSAGNIARWNGTSWSALGNGLNGPVNALAIYRGQLCAGGLFTDSFTAGAFVARWTGSAWSILDQGLDSNVDALAVSGTNLYAGGMFTMISAQNLLDRKPANRIARWDGSQWSALGSGLSGTVDALAADGAGHLFVVGSFTTAGTNASLAIAQANLGAAPGRFGSSSYSPATGFQSSFEGGTVGEPYRIQASPSLTSPNWVDLTNFTYSDTLLFTDQSVSGTTQKVYRALSP